MSKKKVKERIKMYADTSKQSEVRMQEFKVLYNQNQKLWFIYMKYYARDLQVRPQLTQEEIDEKIKNVKTVQDIEKLREPNIFADTWSFYEEMECYDGKGWLKISNGFKPEDFLNVLKECTPSKFNIKDVRIKKHTV